jgi:SAM-dependent methyltransferase
MTGKRPDIHRTLDRARAGFAQALLSPGYIEMIADADHLAGLLELCGTATGKRYLDIGTGRGYVAWALARTSPAISVTGLDIVGPAIDANRRAAVADGCGNIEFATYGGTCLPFPEQWFHGAVSRYAFHHLPRPDLSASEIHRVLEPGGFCVIADAAADPADDLDFVNRFAGLRDDGHVCYYRESSLLELFSRAGFSVAASFHSSITFPRPRDSRYEQLLAHTPSRVLDLYRIRVEDEQIRATVQVMNVCFRKPASRLG